MIEKIKNKEKQESEEVVVETKQEEKKEKPKEEKKIKKTSAVINSFDLPISTKNAIAICRFIKRKEIKTAIRELEEVVRKKRAIPMKGEIPHRKGKGMMSGRYPKNAAEYFIKILKNLSGNAEFNGLDEPIISEAVANVASQPHGRFGKYRKKRTHLKIVAKEKIIKEKKNKERER